jgi:serine/threonine-protein kinase
MTLLYVPAGEFTMGSENGLDNEKPVREIYLDAFWIDQTEVTNFMYSKCVQDGTCNPPRSSASSARTSYYGNSDFNEFPVIYVSWENADEYCEWVERRLPTEAEWEKAARGTDGFSYPWGNNAPDSELLSFNGNTEDTTQVGFYPMGASPYGALDMAGNVYEWVADWYNPSYYSAVSSPDSNPLGPANGTSRVLRGGAWYGTESQVRSTDRSWNVPSTTATDIGFRCAMDATP